MCDYLQLSLLFSTADAHRKMICMILIADDPRLFIFPLRIKFHACRKCKIIIFLPQPEILRVRFLCKFLFFQIHPEKPFSLDQ